jgi:type IV pilus assembly protein PilX
MKTTPKLNGAKFQCEQMPASACVTPKQKFRHDYLITMKQRGVVLFFALVALVIMSLAAVALIRSVDTSTMIAGNLAFKQAAASSGDAGLESALTDLLAIQTAMDATGLSVYNDYSNGFNNDGGLPSSAASAVSAGICTGSGCGPACCVNKGYYSFASTQSLTDGTGIQWDNNDSTLVTSGDNSGNSVRYVIQRMCRTTGQLLNTHNCLFGGVPASNGQQSVPLASSICNPAINPGCPPVGAAVMYRITARIAGPRNTVSYIQSFIY